MEDGKTSRSMKPIRKWPSTRAQLSYDQLGAIIDRIAHDSYQINITSIDAEHGRFLKHIKFRFPVCFGDRETQKDCKI